jgi:hypothetical protein
MAYCTADEVNEILGGSLTPEAEDAAAGVVEGVSAFIDLYTGYSYATSGAITSEVQTVRSGQIILSHAPVSTIETISVTDPYVGAPPVALVDGVTYQLVDPSSGLVLLSACDGARATVSYTAAVLAVPAHINLAAKILSAHCIRYAIDPTGFTLSKLESGTARLTYVGGGSGDGAGPGAGLPAMFEALLGAGAAGGGSHSWVFA